MSAGHTLSGNTLSTTDMTLELSTTKTRKKSSSGFSDTLITDSLPSALTVIDETETARPYKVNCVIIFAFIFLFLGKIVIPICITITFAFELEIVEQWNTDIIEVAQCHDGNTQTECKCDGLNLNDEGTLCEIHIEGSYVEISIALNTMVLIVEMLWFGRMLFGLRRHSLCNKLGFFQAIAELTRDSKCCLFVWRLFEFCWYIVIVFQFDNLESKCNCVESDDTFEWTNRGFYYLIVYYLDITAVAVLFLYLVSKIIFYYSMLKMTHTAGAFFNKGPFWAQLKIYYIDGYRGTEGDSMSVWSPLKQREEDIKYTAKHLKLHYKGWK